MANGGYDGSLKFDTQVDTEGFSSGINDLTKAVERLTSVVQGLSDKMVSSFSRAGSSAAKSVKDIDSVAESAKDAQKELERLQKERDATFTGTISNYSDTPSTLPDDGKRYDIYGRDVDELIAKNKALEASMRETATTVQAEASKEESSLIGLKASMQMAFHTLKGVPSRITEAFQSAGGATRDLQSEVDRYTDALYYAEKAGHGLGDADYDKAYIGLQKAKQKAEEYRKSLMGVDSGQKKAEKSSRKMAKSFKKTRDHAVPLTKSILKLSSMFKLMLLRMSMRAVIQSSKEGFQNLAQYSETANVALSSLMSSMTMLKNSFAAAFAPIVEYVSPVMVKFLKILSEANNQLAHLMAALTGKDSYVKSVEVQEDYAESLDKTNSSLKDEEKALKKTSYAFDDLIQRQTEAKSDTNPGKADPSEMFDTITVENDMKDLAETIKGIFSELFSPLQESWNKNGPATVAAAKNAFNTLKILAHDIGKSFLQVWNDEGYGQKISSDLMITFGNMAQTVANLASRFDEAWTAADLGTGIVRHLGDIVLEITGFFREASETLKDWSAKLNFAPLLKSFDGLLVSIQPAVNRIGKLILWLLEDVLLPLASWTITDAMPVFFDLLAAAVDLAVAAIDALTPLAEWLWNEFLKPLGQWTGSLFINAVKKIIEYLNKFSDWISEHQELVENITIAVLAFFAAWKFTEFVSGISKILSKLPGLISNLAALDLKFIAIVAIIGSIVYIAAKVAQAWDKMTPGEKMATKIIAVAGAIALVVAAMAALAKDFVTLAIAGSIAAIAGLSILGIASSANSRSSSHSGAPYSTVTYGLDTASFRMPRLATGTVVPARAGEFAAILGDNNREAEVVSPLSTIEQALENVMARHSEENNRRPIQIVMEVDKNRFARLVYEMSNAESQRVGVRMVTEG